MELPIPPDLLSGDSAILGELVKRRLRDLQVPRKLIDSHHLRRLPQKPAMSMSLMLPFHSGITVADTGERRLLLATVGEVSPGIRGLKGTHPRA